MVVGGVLAALSLGCTAQQAFPDTSKSSSTKADPLVSDITSTAVRYHLREAPLPGAKSDPRTEPLVLKGRGSKGKIVDLEGNVVIGHGQKSIYGLELSPSHNHALVYYGDADYEVIDSHTHDVVAALPSHAEVEDSTGFGWHFIDDYHLIGDASLPSTDIAGKTLAEIEALPPRAVILYIHELASGSLIPVEIDDSLPPIFLIHDVAGWNVTLLTYDDELVGARIVRSPAAEDANPP